jgi:hypothetical protein
MTSGHIAGRRRRFAPRRHALDERGPAAEVRSISFKVPGIDPAAPQRMPKAPDTDWGRPRGRLGWSLRQLSERTGINPGDLSKIERGRSCPTPDQARRLLAAFDKVAG